MLRPLATLTTALAVTGGLCACSGDGSLLGSSLTTSSVASNPVTAQASAAPKIDPACASLQARIDALRKEGVTERVEKASVGTTPNVSVKRASLAQMAELDKANAEFQAKCSTLGPRPLPIQAQVAPVATTAPVVTARAATPAVAPVVTTQVPKQ
jgi:uncharacterized protein YccT (UPF0319 family)